MKKRLVVSVVVLALSCMAGLAFAQYDKDLVVGVMRASGAAIGELNKAIGSGDFFTAAEKFMTIAQGFKSLETVTPKKGSKAEWDSIHDLIIKTAFKGIGACGEEDKDGAAAAVAEMSTLIKKGHSMFR